MGLRPDNLAVHTDRRAAVRNQSTSRATTQEKKIKVRYSVMLGSAAMLLGCDPGDYYACIVSHVF